MNARGPERVAVVGSGVAGLLAAHVLAKRCHVTLYEADTRLGGHADTHVVDGIGVDTGFIVHNERTYPHLLRLFRELGVDTQDSEMSMSVRDDALGLEYAGALGLSGLFPTRGNLARPAYLRMLVEIPRFHRMARRLLETDEADPAGTPHPEALETLAAFLDRGRFSPLFRTHFMESLVACVWSCDPAVALEYPARYLFTFLQHHGMLAVFGSPTWRTVTGGSREYVRRVAAGLHDVRTGTKVTSLLERPEGVELTDGNGAVTTYDAVVVATHPHQALAMLAEPTAAQREVLAAITYSPNTTQLHTDDSLLPRAPRARASWNYLRRPDDDTTGAVTVTYDLTRLMRLPRPTSGPHAGKRFLVTLGGTDLVDPATVIDTMEYEHPLYTPASVAAQRRLPECDSDRLVFAGAWHGWGFHEDGARSGVAAAARLGVTWDDAAPVGGGPAGHLREGPREPNHPSPLVPRSEGGQAHPRLPGALAPASLRAGAGGRRTALHTPALYDASIIHVRRKPLLRRFEQRSTAWLVDLDALPDHGVLGRFEARDHLGDPARSIRDNVAHFLALHGIALDSEERGRGRVRMAANARALGFCFNPISVHWCHAGDGELLAVVVEVHNTYGDRHAYLVHPDEQGRARVDKAMYVSPFHGTDGHYEVAVPVPTDRLEVAVTLHSDDGAVFSASLSGARTAYSPRRAAPAALRGWLQIHAHGVALWARRLPVRPRPEHPRQEGVR